MVDLEVVPSATLGPGVGLSIHDRDPQRFTKLELTLTVFQKHWLRRIPIVVSGVHLDLQISWGPEYFIRHYGDDACEVEDCETGQSFPDFTVAQFFSGFGQLRRPGSQILRLKARAIVRNMGTLLTQSLSGLATQGALQRCVPRALG